jgi:hypothetical protein
MTNIDQGGAGRQSSVVADAASSSTNALEVAVALESAGVNDRVAKEQYGKRDVFALAEAAMARADPGSPRAALVMAKRPQDRPTVTRRFFYLRGLLYAVPAFVALSLLPAADHVESALMLGGLALSWASGYGMSYIAWAHIGNLDTPAAHRFLRRAILVGILVATVVAVLAVYAALMLTVTMQVTLWTVLLLVGQTAYLLAAVALLMTGHELRLLIALAPAVVAAIAGLADGPSTPVAGPADTSTDHGPEMIWLAATVLLAVVLALVSTRHGARPIQPLQRGAVRAALMHVLYGLLIAFLVLYPAFNELLNRNFEALPLSVTLAAMPLVVGMGVAESLLYDHRRDVHRMLSATGSPSEFARENRGALLRAHLRFVAAFAAMTAILGAIGVVAFGLTDVRFMLLGLGYVLLGAAIFAAMVLNLMGRIGTVLLTLAAGVAVLVAFSLSASYLVTDATALIWHGLVAAALLVVHAALVRRHGARAVSHW